MKKQRFIAHLGGVMIFSKDAKKLASWYKKNLGLEYEYAEEYKAYYLIFPYQILRSKKKAYEVWGILPEKGRPKLKGKVLTVNYRVHSMDSLVKHLKKNRIKVEGPTTFPEGIFAWTEDPDGNRIELWEDTKLK